MEYIKSEVSKNGKTFSAYIGGRDYDTWYGSYPYLYADMPESKSPSVNIMNYCLKENPNINAWNGKKGDEISHKSKFPEIWRWNDNSKTYRKI